MDERTTTWDFRTDIAIQGGYSEVLRVLGTHYRVFESAYNFLGPYNAKQRNSQLPYHAPERENLVQNIPQRSMNDLSYHALIAGLIKFCEQTKGLRALPIPHPSTISSIQFAESSFEFTNAGKSLQVIGVNEPILLKAAVKNPKAVKHVIIRAKLGKMGTPSVTNWEALFFNTSYGYIPDWVDSQMNTRYVGII